MGHSARPGADQTYTDFPTIQGWSAPRLVAYPSGILGYKLFLVDSEIRRLYPHVLPTGRRWWRGQIRASVAALRSFGALCLRGAANV